MTSTPLVSKTASRPAARRLDPAAPALMPASTWAILRQLLQSRLERHAASRTVPLGPSMRLRFEDEITLRAALQEALAAEDLADDAIVREQVASSARLLPDGGDWRATLFVDTADRHPHGAAHSFLHAAVQQVSLQVGIERIPALPCDPEAELPDMYLGGSSSVHRVRLALPPDVRAALRDGADATLLCTHPLYSWRHRLPGATVRALVRDLDVSRPAASKRTGARRPPHAARAIPAHAHAHAT